MMKKLYTLFLIFFAILFTANLAMAQCTPDPTCTDPEGDGQYCPTEFPNAIEDEYYEQTLTVIAPAEQSGIQLHHIDVLNISNIPPGMNYQCQNDDCSFYPETPKCINVFGTPDVGSWGEYKLYLTIEIFMDIAGNPISLGQITDSSASVYIQPQLYGDFMIDYLMSNTVCIGVETEVTYTGNASPDATYHWDFGPNAVVLSGEGQGPYIITYNDYFETDSISLYVEEGIYTSPVYTESFYVDICSNVETENELSLTIHPNPFNYQVQISGFLDQASVEIFDLSGKMIRDFQIGNTSSNLDLSNLQKGIYLISITTHSQTKTQKIVKQ